MKQLLFILLGVKILFSCSSRDNQQKLQFTSAVVKEEKIFELKENLEMVGGILSFDFLGKDNLIVASIRPSSVTLYDMDGNQLQTIGRNGEGPFEYLSPEIVRTFENRVYVFCRSLLKLMVFTDDGTPLREYTNFSKGIRDFKVYKDNLYIYSSGELDSDIIQVYHLGRGEFLANDFGIKSNEHNILVSYYCSGGMTIKDHVLYFTSVDALTIHRINLESLEYSYQEVKDESFKVDKIKVDHREFMANSEKSIGYIYGADIVTGLYAVDDGLIITTEGGEVEMEALRPVNFYDKRFTRFYKLDNQLQLKEGIINKIKENQNNCLIVSNGMNIYYLISEEETSEAKYVLNKMILE